MKKKEKHIVRLWETLWITPSFINYMNNAMNEASLISDNKMREEYIQTKSSEIIERLHLPYFLKFTLSKTIRDRKRHNPPPENTSLRIETGNSKQEGSIRLSIDIYKYTTLQDLKELIDTEYDNIKLIQSRMIEIPPLPSINKTHLKLYILHTTNNYSPKLLATMDEFNKYTENQISQYIIRTQKKIEFLEKLIDLK